MAIKTIDLDALAGKASNLYESIVILSKRAKQVAAREKAELDSKLRVFDDLSLDGTDDLRTNEEQVRISLDYERRPKSPGVAIEEMLNDEIYYRNPSAEE